MLHVRSDDKSYCVFSAYTVIVKVKNIAATAVSALQHWCPAVPASPTALCAVLSDAQPHTAVITSSQFMEPLRLNTAIVPRSQLLVQPDGDIRATWRHYCVAKCHSGNDISLPHSHEVAHTCDAHNTFQCRMRKS